MGAPPWESSFLCHTLGLPNVTSVCSLHPSFPDLPPYFSYVPPLPDTPMSRVDTNLTTPPPPTSPWSFPSHSTYTCAYLQRLQHLIPPSVPLLCSCLDLCPFAPSMTFCTSSLENSSYTSDSVFSWADHSYQFDPEDGFSPTFPSLSRFQRPHSLSPQPAPFRITPDQEYYLTALALADPDTFMFLYQCAQTHVPSFAIPADQLPDYTLDPLTGCLLNVPATLSIAGPASEIYPDFDSDLASAPTNPSAFLRLLTSYHHYAPLWLDPDSPTPRLRSDKCPSRITMIRAAESLLSPAVCPIPSAVDSLFPHHQPGTSRSSSPDSCSSLSDYLSDPRPDPESDTSHLELNKCPSHLALLQAAITELSPEARGTEPSAVDRLLDGTAHTFSPSPQARRAGPSAAINELSPDAHGVGPSGIDRLLNGTAHLFSPSPQDSFSSFSDDSFSARAYPTFDFPPPPYPSHFSASLFLSYNLDLLSTPQLDWPPIYDLDPPTSPFWADISAPAMAATFVTAVHTDNPVEYSRVCDGVPNLTDTHMIGNKTQAVCFQPSTFVCSQPSQYYTAIPNFTQQ